METLELDAPQQTEANGFAVELSDKLGNLRSALGKLVSEMGSPRTAQELNKISGGGRTLCWQVYRIVHTNELASEARHAPTPSSLKRLLKAASSCGVSKNTIAAVQSSAEAFQDFSKRAAGDRAAFDSLLAGATPGESNEKILMAQRRTAYRSMSHIWGVQTDLQYFSAMVMRSQTSDAVDYVNIGGQRGIRRLRPDSQFTLYGYRRDPNGPEVPDETSISLDTEAASRYGMPVLPGFSSNPLPEVEKVELPSGWVLYNTVGREIGPAATVDCTFGRVHRNQPFSIDVDGRRYWNLTFSHIRKPVATSVLELLVHRPSFPKIRPELIVHQHQEGDLSMEAARRAMQFPVDERITNEGRADKVSLSDLPGHSEILRFAANAAGWDLGEFDLYRFRMSYPIMFSATRMFFYLD